jgi:hypothetical protein
MENTKMLMPFGCWYGVQVYLDNHAYVYYKQDPNESGHGIIAVRKKQFKNGKLRMAWAHGEFTAGPADLENFFYKDMA